MGNRLSQIATRTGDHGTTGLGDNTRVSKDHLRVHAMGDVDELNSHIGVLLCETMPDGVRHLLVEIQHQLFNLGGELSIPGFELLKKEAILELDEALGNLQCDPAQVSRIHLACWQPRCLASTRVPYRGAAGGAGGCCTWRIRHHQRCAPPVFEPPERLDVCALPRAEPHGH